MRPTRDNCAPKRGGVAPTQAYALPNLRGSRQPARMAVVAPFAELRSQAARDSRFVAAFEYVAEILRQGTPSRRRFDALTLGASEKQDLGGGVFAIEQVYHTKNRSDGFFESHRKHIDVQVIVSGIEVMELEDIGRLVVSMPYDAERDLIKYTDTAAASRLNLRAGDAALFFPADGHMPCLHPAAGPTLVRKTVVKVPV
jgi:YhcH/YjgK/YiaL family protein